MPEKRPENCAKPIFSCEKKISQWAGKYGIDMARGNLSEPFGKIQENAWNKRRLALKKSWPKRRRNSCSKTASQTCMYVYACAPQDGTTYKVKKKFVWFWKTTGTLMKSATVCCCCQKAFEKVCTVLDSISLAHIRKEKYHSKKEQRKSKQKNIRKEEQQHEERTNSKLRKTKQSGNRMSAILHADTTKKKSLHANAVSVVAL